MQRLNRKKVYLCNIIYYTQYRGKGLINPKINRSRHTATKLAAKVIFILRVKVDYLSTCLQGEISELEFVEFKN